MTGVEQIAARLTGGGGHASKPVDTRASAEIAAQLEARGWMRDVAGDRDFDAALAVIANAEHQGKGLWIMGTSGSGKTALATAAYGRVPVVRCADMELDAAIYALGGIILDDLGSESTLNEYGVRREPVAEWFCRQYDNGGIDFSRFAATTNLTPPEIRERYGERFWSRFSSSALRLVLTGGDKRGAVPVPAASADDPEVAREFRAFVSQMRQSGWHNVNVGVWATMLAKRLDAPKAKAACIMAVDAWEREMDQDPDRDEKLKWLAASQEREVVEQNERGLEMVREWRTGR